MKFVRYNTDFSVLSVEILEPREYPDLIYYYPDGITFGLFKKTTYILSEKDINGVVHFYESLEDFTKGKEFYVFQKGGLIFEKGSVKLRFKDIEETITFRYTDKSELKEFLENLTYKHGFPFSSYVSFDTKELKSLYEYKESLS